MIAMRFSINALTLIVLLLFTAFLPTSTLVLYLLWTLAYVPADRLSRVHLLTNEPPPTATKQVFQPLLGSTALAKLFAHALHEEFVSFSSSFRLLSTTLSKSCLCFESIGMTCMAYSSFDLQSELKSIITVFLLGAMLVMIPLSPKKAL